VADRKPTGLSFHIVRIQLEQLPDRALGYFSLKTAGMDAVVCREGGVVPDAVERRFERICAAANKPGSLGIELCPISSQLNPPTT
jgi:hypothetical protein